MIYFQKLRFRLSSKQFPASNIFLRFGNQLLTLGRTALARTLSSSTIQTKINFMMFSLFSKSFLEVWWPTSHAGSHCPCWNDFRCRPLQVVIWPKGSISHIYFLVLVVFYRLRCGPVNNIVMAVSKRLFLVLIEFWDTVIKWYLRSTEPWLSIYHIGTSWMSGNLIEMSLNFSCSLAKQKCDSSFKSASLMSLDRRICRSMSLHFHLLLLYFRFHFTFTFISRWETDPFAGVWCFTKTLLAGSSHLTSHQNVAFS